MIVKTYTHDHDMPEGICEFEVPDNMFERSAVLWGHAKFDILLTVCKYLEHFRHGSVASIYTMVNEAIAYDYYKLVIKECLQNDILRADGRGRIMYINPSWKELFL